MVYGIREFDWSNTHQIEEPIISAPWKFDVFFSVAHEVSPVQIPAGICNAVRYTLFTCRILLIPVQLLHFFIRKSTVMKGDLFFQYFPTIIDRLWNHNTINTRLFHSAESQLASLHALFIRFPVRIAEFSIHKTSMTVNYCLFRPTSTPSTGQWIFHIFSRSFLWIYFSSHRAHEPLKIENQFQCLPACRWF